MNTETTNVELLPNCPFCGGNKITGCDDDGLFWKRCISCGATGPETSKYSGEEGEPYPDWNTRVSVSVPVVQNSEHVTASPILAFVQWLNHYVKDIGHKLSQTEYGIAYAAFIAAHPGEGPRSHTMSAPVGEVESFDAQPIEDMYAAFVIQGFEGGEVVRKSDYDVAILQNQAIRGLCVEHDAATNLGFINEAHRQSFKIRWEEAKRGNVVAWNLVDSLIQQRDTLTAERGSLRAVVVELVKSLKWAMRIVALYKPMIEGEGGESEEQFLMDESTARAALTKVGGS